MVSSVTCPVNNVKDLELWEKEGFASVPNNRVVITGIGVVSPLGLDFKTTWENIITGKSGIDKITLFDASNMKTKIAGEVKGFEPTNYMDRKEARRMDRFAQFAVAATGEALKQAGIEITEKNQTSIGIFIGSGIGGLTTLYNQTKILVEQGPDRVSPFLVPMMISDMAAAQISMVMGNKGPNLCITSACSSGSDAIGAAFEMVKRGSSPVMLAGGAEAIINPLGITAFNALNALSVHNDEPQRASRPFDAERDGFVIGEGAGVLVLEALEHAKARGANILAEIAGYGASGDAYHITQPSDTGEGGARAMTAALTSAGIQPQELDYVKAHGTSTQLNDKVETMAIKAVLGEKAYQTPVSSVKSMTGHLIGAAGAIESAVSINVIREGVIPPTINLEHSDPSCDLDYVPNVARRAAVKTVMCNSFGFGGHNSVLIFKKYSAES